MKTFTRGLFTAVIAAIAIVAGAGSARAAAITYTVNEGAVPGADPALFPANDITGKYEENLILDSGGAGTFTAYLIVNFTSYVLNGVPVADQIGGNTELTDPNEYELYALVSVTGTYSPAPAGTNTQLNFEPVTSTASIWLDPLQNTVQNYTNATTTGGTVDDILVMTATNLDQPTSLGQVVLSPTNSVLGGFYALQYNTVNLIYPQYWPTLASLTLTATATGDVDTTTQGSVFPTDIKGDTDLTFEAVPAVPEPASLVLLGTGLLTAGAARRRSKNKKQ